MFLYRNYTMAWKTGIVPYYIPADNGGSQLDSSAGLGKPLNVIISNLSSPSVLTKAGLIKYSKYVFTNSIRKESTSFTTFTGLYKALQTSKGCKGCKGISLFPNVP